VNITPNDIGGRFNVVTETGWDPPTLLKRIGLILDMLLSKHLPTVAGDPKWRVVLHDRERVLAASAWSTDWPAVEQLERDWTTRISEIDPSQVPATARRWANETPQPPPSRR
jgi:hypothetical protein